MSRTKQKVLAEWWEEGCSPPHLHELLSLLIKDSHAPYDFTALVKRIEALENREVLNDAVAVCRMVTAASMSTTSSHGESSIGWQRGDGVTSTTIRDAARKVIAAVDKKP